MNIVIPYQREARKDELIYTLRAAERNIESPVLYVVGDRPEGLTNFTHIHHPRCTDNTRKEQNIFEKLCASPVEDFIALADDHILLKPFTGERITIGWPDWGTYKYSVENTRNLFPGAVNYDSHRPFLMNVNKLQLLKEYAWPKYGYCVKSLYGNHYQLEQTPGPDCKIRYVPVKENWQDWDCVSTAPVTWDEIKKYVQGMFPTKSQWEV